MSVDVVWDVTQNSLWSFQSRNAGPINAGLCLLGPAGSGGEDSPPNALGAADAPASPELFT